MTGRGGKRKAGTAPAAAGSSTTKKRQQELGDDDWCASCWSWPKDDCRGAGHLLVDKDTAKEGAQAEFAVTRKELERLQGRLDDLERALADKAPVLEAVLNGKDDDGVSIEGCDLRISLAAESLTDADKATIVEALDETDVSFPTPNDHRKYAFIEVGAEFSEEFISKFPDRTPGQALPKGVVVMPVGPRYRMHLQVWTRGMRPHEGQDTKIFGWLTATPDEFGASCCDGCEAHWHDCVCKTGEASTTISDVNFVD